MGINHATSVLMNIWVAIMFAVFKNELEILDCMLSKMQSRPKMSCLFFTVLLVSLQSAIVTFPGHTHFLANIVFLKPDKILLMANRVRTCRKNIFKLKNGSVLLHMLWTYLTYTFSVKGI